MNILGNRIKKERKTLGISREDLAKKLGVSYSAIAMYEQGNREPNNELLLKMCELFDCTIDYLMGKSNYRTTYEEFLNLGSPAISMKDFGDNSYFSKDDFVIVIAWLHNQIQQENNIDNFTNESKLKITQLYNSFLEVPEARKIINDYNSNPQKYHFNHEIYHTDIEDNEDYVDIFDALGFELTDYERNFIFNCLPNETLLESLQYFEGSEDRKQYIKDAYDKVLDFINYLQKNSKEPISPIHKLSDINDIVNYKKLLNQLNISKQDIEKFYMCPVYGRISAGQPNWAEECIEGRLPINPVLMNIVDPEECYFLRVNGESMNKVVKNGAFALIRKTDWVENGEIAVVLVNSFDATLKKFTKQEDLVILEPISDDPSFTAQVYTKDNEIKIIGKYIGKMEMEG